MQVFYALKIQKKKIHNFYPFWIVTQIFYIIHTKSESSQEFLVQSTLSELCYIIDRNTYCIELILIHFKIDFVQKRVQIPKM